MNEVTRELMHSSSSDEWATPDEVVKAVERRTGWAFTLDPCATQVNAKARKYFTIDDDGLKQNWGRHTVWVNPPYSDVASWVEKSVAAQKAGARVVVLVPARTDTRWFHAAVKEEVGVIFMKGRIKFGESRSPAPFPSCLILPGTKYVNFEDWRDW